MLAATKFGSSEVAEHRVVVVVEPQRAWWRNLKEVLERGMIEGVGERWAKSSSFGRPMRGCPAILRLPDGAEQVQDADEEVFDLYTALQACADDAQLSTGLGFVDPSSATIDVSFTIQCPAQASTSPRKKTKKTERDFTVSAELVQDTRAHHHRRGDTGSVVWRASVFFAEALWHHHLRPSPAALLDMTVFRRARILELGAGTGCLAVLCRDLVDPQQGEWVATDQFDNLRLVQRNFARHDMTEPRFVVQERDWLAASTASESRWDVVVAVDCLFNEALVPAFLRALHRAANPADASGDATLVLVVTELRSPEVLRLFLAEWLALASWTVVRVTPSSLGTEVRLASPRFVVWCGWKHA